MKIEHGIKGFVVIDDGQKFEGLLYRDKETQWINVKNDLGIFEINPNNIIFLKKENMKNDETGPGKKKLMALGYVSTLLIFIASPMVAIMVDSILGWLFYSGSAIFGMIFTWRNNIKPIFIQFAWYMAWNLIAILTRLYF